MHIPTITRNSKLFPIVLAIFAALPPLAINTYAPAIPLIANSFNVTDSDVLATFTTYFIGFSFGMLFWGAVSDKYGRKNIILIGTIIYVISTILCSLSTSFKMLELLRLIQGLSDSVGGVIAFSIARDCYKGHKLTSMIATIIIIMLVAPIVAPIIGTVLTYTTNTWQSSFHFLTLYGVILLIFALMIEETLNKDDRQKSIKELIPSYFSHFKNPGFMLATIASGMAWTALFMYIASASIIYLKIYNTGPILYCIYYAAAVIASIMANLLIKRLSSRVNNLRYTNISISLLIICCLGLFIVSKLNLDNAINYTIFMCILCLSVSFTCTILYSFSMNVVSHNFGTANSISNFLKNMIAGGGALVISYYHGSILVNIVSFYQLLFIILCMLLVLAIYQLKIKTSIDED
ncbi:drug resistance transporter, Bcr/CflA subfamily protein [Francisella frigiditurris]|uniref:Bcr/CflA family efflux transporter n=1 Tax=Francisella frigiditurris TaxID=1542390 RepID=A0A1J0KUX8_9GAMM|nr:multidrug effflux MFS transporter [Francisella frigiditurris]APC97420.1 drug resistance transporter, Bcr/CflA subfamily protein [Francisella frigiditurris]